MKTEVLRRLPCRAQWHCCPVLVGRAGACAIPPLCLVLPVCRFHASPFCVPSCCRPGVSWQGRDGVFPVSAFNTWNYSNVSAPKD